MYYGFVLIVKPRNMYYGFVPIVKPRNTCITVMLRVCLVATDEQRALKLKHYTTASVSSLALLTTFSLRKTKQPNRTSN